MTRGHWLNLVLGIILFGAGGFCLLHFTALSTLTVKQAERASAPKASASSEDPTDAAKLQVYGVLAQEASGDNGTPAPQEEVRKPIPSDSMIDHSSAAAAASKHFLHKSFPVSNYEGFEFIVPARAFRPTVQGKYTSAGGQVDVLLMDEHQLSYFVQGLPGSVTDIIEARQGGEADWPLNSPLAGDAKYYLVFRNPRKSGTLRVTADFTFNSE